MKQQTKETSISNDSLEVKFFSLYKPPLQPAKSSNYSNRTNMLDRDGLRIFVVEHYLAEDNAKMELDTFICEAVNNYNALKQSNKELIEALENLIKVATRETKDLIAWDGAILLDASIDRANQKIKKAKQL